MDCTYLSTISSISESQIYVLLHFSRNVFTVIKFAFSSHFVYLNIIKNPDDQFLPEPVKVNQYFGKTCIGLRSRGA